jgi:hypothetical protein
VECPPKLGNPGKVHIGNFILRNVSGWEQARSSGSKEMVGSARGEWKCQSVRDRINTGDFEDFEVSG